MFFRNNYFSRLRKTNKFLFLIVCSFSLLSIFVNFIFKKELTPIYKWDVYSGAIVNQKQYSFFEVRYNDNKLLNFRHTWMEPEKLFFTNTLSFFMEIKNNNNEDPMKKYYTDWFPRHNVFKAIFGSLKLYMDTTEINEFPLWYIKYLSQYSKNKIDSIQIYKRTVEYEKYGTIKEIATTLVYKIV
ncbi:MAG: hypothetical protein M3004_05445 [Bacteroidota bacterium]|nr:hypothetical protein [Bacteroidota bacterium]